MFQYINNEWQKKQLHVTLKDILSQTSPCHIPYDDIKSLWPIQDSLPQTSPQQPGHDIHSHRLGGKGAIVTTGTTKQCAGILQQREKAEQQNIARPSPTQQHQYNDDRQLKTKTIKVEDQSTVVSPIKGCGCKTGCTTKKCGCKRQESYCGPSCQCSDCKNYQQYAFHLPEGDQVKVKSDKMKKVEVKMVSPTKGCGCKTGCTTNRCRCKKEGLVCDPTCTCSNCENNQ